MLKVLVPIKRVVDAATKVRVKTDFSGMDLASAKMAMNPFCEIAVVEAVKLRTMKAVSEVVALTIGPKQASETLRNALAIGADRGIHIQTDLRLDQDLLPFTVASVLRKIVERDAFRLVILGKQSIDGDCGQTGQLLAGMMGWAQATQLYKLTVEGETVTAVREIDGGLQTLKFVLPAVVTCDLRLNTPGPIAIPNIMKAKKKPIETIDLKTLGVDLTPGYVTERVEPPPSRKGGVKVASVDELLEKLRSEAKVL